MDEMTLRKHLLENVTKMLNWISDEFEKADCDVPYVYKFSYGFIYGYNCDCLEFSCSKNPKFYFRHYGSCQMVKNGKMYREEEDYTQSYLTNRHWYIPQENAEGFKKAMSEWENVKSAVSNHLEKVANVANFEV